jgi:hypothetical protein
MLERNMITVHGTCLEVNRQLKNWSSNKGNLSTAGAGLVAALALICSDLREKGELKVEAPAVRSYTRNNHRDVRLNSQSFNGFV